MRQPQWHRQPSHLLARAIRGAALGLLVAGSSMASPTLLADTTAQQQNRHYSIAAGPLSAALTEFASQAGITLAIEPALVEGKQSSGLDADVSVEEGLNRLLRGSGLRATPQGGTAYTLYPAPEGTQLELDEVTITGRRLGATTEGTGSYTTGSTSTATKMNLSIRETPQSISVITRQQIEDQGLVTVTDALVQSPGVSVQKTGAERYNFYARGFSLDSIMYDGLPTSLGASADVLTPANLAMYDRVEVVRGSTGLVLGSGNPSAAINLVRKRPTAEFQSSVTLSAGSWDNYRSELDVSGPLNANGTLRGRAVATYQDTDSFQDGVGNEHSLIYAIGEADLSESTVLSVGFTHQNENNNVAWGGGLPTAVDGSDLHLSRSTSFLADWEYWDKETDMLFVELKHQFDNNWILRAAMNKSWSKLDYLGGYPGRTSGDVSRLRYRVSGSDYYDDRQSSYDIYLSGPFELMGRTHEFVTGYSKRKYDYDTAGSGIYDVAGNVDPNSFDPDSWTRPDISIAWIDKREMDQDGVYASARFSIADRLKLIIGSRLDWYDYEYFYDYLGSVTNTQAKETRHLTRYAGLLYDLDQWHTAYVSYTDIFQPQTNRDSGNQLIEPIEGKNYEIGIKGEYFNGALNASMAIFQIDQENRARTVDDPTTCASWPSSTCYEATGKVRSQGFEFELSGALTPNWQFTAGYTFAEAKYRKDSTADNEGELFDTDIPRHQFKLTTMYTLPGDLHRWRIGGNLYHQSSTYNEGTTAGQNWKIVQDGYNLVGLMAGYKASEQLDLRFAVNNLLDKKYYQTIGQNISSWPTTFYGAPRNLQLSATYRF